MLMSPLVAPTLGIDRHARLVVAGRSLTIGTVSRSSTSTQARAHVQPHSAFRSPSPLRPPSRSALPSLCPPPLPTDPTSTSAPVAQVAAFCDPPRRTRSRTCARGGCVHGRRRLAVPQLHHHARGPVRACGCASASGGRRARGRRRTPRARSITPRAHSGEGGEARRPRHPRRAHRRRAAHATLRRTSALPSTSGAAMSRTLTSTRSLQPGASMPSPGLTLPSPEPEPEPEPS